MQDELLKVGLPGGGAALCCSRRSYMHTCVLLQQRAIGFDAKILILLLVSSSLWWWWWWQWWCAWRLLPCVATIKRKKSAVSKVPRFTALSSNCLPLGFVEKVKLLQSGLFTWERLCAVWPMCPQVRLSVLKREEEVLVREEERLQQEKIRHIR